MIFHKPAQTSSSSKNAGPPLRAKKAKAFWSLGRTCNVFLKKMDALRRFLEFHGTARLSCDIKMADIKMIADLLFYLAYITLKR